MKRLIIAVLTSFSAFALTSPVLADSGMEVCNDSGKICADLATREFVNAPPGQPINIVRINGRVLAGVANAYEIRWEINCNLRSIRALAIRQIPLGNNLGSDWYKPKDPSSSYLEPSDLIVDNACADPS